jgi:hypothetical protein
MSLEWKGINPLLARRPRGGNSRIEQDEEVFDFINGLDRYHTIKELQELISRRFGKARTPSRSGLGRFLAKIPRDNNPAREDAGQ